MYHTHTLSLNDILADMACKAITDQGSKQILNMQPKTDLDWIENSMAKIYEMTTILAESGSLPLNSLVGFNKAFSDLQKQAVLSASQIAAIGSLLEDIERLKRFMTTRLDQAPQVAAYALSLHPLADLHTQISQTVYGDQVLDSASPKLAKLRKTIRLTEDKIKDKLGSIMASSADKGMLSDSLIALRQGRYVIPVKAHMQSKISGTTLDKSSSGGTAFIEPEAVRKLSDTLANLKIDEENEIYRILSSLTQTLAHHEQALSINQEGMVHYDVLSAKAKYALLTQGAKVKMNDQGLIDIVGGRHPQLGAHAIPLNLHLGKTRKGIVITGPNTGGKTVVLKTVGLFSLMAMCGLLVPCDPTSHLSVFRDVLADIGDGQSITQNLSTFSSHITNINGILNLAGPSSLVLLDEVGSGTEPNEGAGIAMAILDLLKERGTTLLATTHYTQLKDYAKNTPGFVNGSMLFDAHTLQPLYQIHLGQAGKSHALLIALKLGMDPELLNRAHQLTYGTPFNQKDYADMITLKPVVQVAQEPQPGPQAKVEPVQPTQKKAAITWFNEGDSVYVHFMKASGIIMGPPNKKGEYLVEIKGKKFTLSHKRLKPYIDPKDLYPEDYDMTIVTQSVERRKTEKKVSKGKKGFVIEHRS